MGTGDLTGKTGLPDDADAIVTAYLSRLDAALPLPAAERDRIVAEATDALICATQTRIRAGEEPAAAATAAVAEFGDPAMLARQFAAALAPRMARRVGLTLIGSGPLVGLCWVAAIGSGPGLVSRIASALSVMPLLPVVLVSRYRRPRSRCWPARIRCGGVPWPMRHHAGRVWPHSGVSARTPC